MSRLDVVLDPYNIKVKVAWLPKRMTAGETAGQKIWMKSYFEIPDCMGWAPVLSEEMRPTRYIDGRRIHWSE